MEPKEERMKDITKRFRMNEAEKHPMVRLVMKFAFFLVVGGLLVQFTRL